MTRLHLLCCLLPLISCSAVEPPDGPTRLGDPKLVEASGLAVSQRDPSYLWLINDSGSGPVVHLAGIDGQAHGAITLRQVDNRDWEGLASFSLNGKPYLMVADVGDNAAKRKEVRLHMVPEPSLPEAGTRIDQVVAPEWTVRFRYEDGPRDCEGVAVDPSGNRILLLTKRDKPPAIYHLPLAKPTRRGVMTAERLGPLAPLSLPKGSLPHPFAYQPTGLDISTDGRMAVVLTYRGVYLFRRQPGMPWAEVFARAPETLGAHGLSQAEAIGFSKDGRSVLITTEGRRPRMVRMEIPDS